MVLFDYKVVDWDPDERNEPSGLEKFQIQRGTSSNCFETFALKFERRFPAEKRFLRVRLGKKTDNKGPEKDQDCIS